VAAPAADQATPPSFPPGLFPSGREPDEVRERLTRATHAQVSRACGNISRPWAHRGRAGRRMSLRDFGRRTADGAWTRIMAELLLREATVDSALKVPGIVSPCDAKAGLPIYLVRFEGSGRPTFAVLRFDLGVALLFDAELPLGMIGMGDRADSLWAAVAGLLDDDPLFQRPRPAVSILDPVRELHGDDVSPDTLPVVIEQVPPDYPELASSTRVEGTVYVQARVGANGLVQDALVLSGPPGLRDASLDAIWRWKFKPAFVGDSAVAVWVTVPLNFRIR
jgi:TonB family protein